jgi:N-ethylmaleimide reductase
MLRAPVRTEAKTVKKLLSPARLGSLMLPNRMVMSPMTRCRAGDGGVPTPLNAEYYRQRASAGLILAEGTQVSPQGVGYPATPGIHSNEQVQGWRLVTDAVHAAGGRIFLQLWHCGRVSHSFFHNGELPVAPSPVAINGKTLHFRGDGGVPFETPRPLELSEIPLIVDHYRQGAQNAKAAGFDGVEIHGAFGYLPDQFLQDGTNQRTDEYGGPVENRARFLLEVTEAAIEVWGKEHVGVKLSPSNTFNDMRDSDPLKTFSFAVSALNRLGVGYVHIMEAGASDLRHGGKAIPATTFRPHFQGTLIVNQDYDQAKAEAVLARGDADLVSFARLFLANPDLPERFSRGASLNSPDPSTFYGGGEKGYTDYPFRFET